MGVEVGVDAARDRARAFYNGHHHPSSLSQMVKGWHTPPRVCGGGVIAFLAQGGQRLFVASSMSHGPISYECNADPNALRADVAGIGPRAGAYRHAGGRTEGPRRIGQERDCVSGEEEFRSFVARSSAVWGVVGA